MTLLLIIASTLVLPEGQQLVAHIECGELTDLNLYTIFYNYTPEIMESKVWNISKH